MRDVVMTGGVSAARRWPGGVALVGLPVLWWAACGVVALLGCVGIGAWGLDGLRSAFEADARIVHRLLSQRAAQHDAILATLNLLQGGVTSEAAGASVGPAVRATSGTAADPVRSVSPGPEQRLPALYPQLLAVTSRVRDQAWSAADLRAAEAESRRLRHAVLVRVDLREGRAMLLQAGEPVSHALTIDLSQLLSAADRPAPVDLASTFELRLAGSDAAWVLQPGRRSDWAWQHELHKTLASSSQPFDLVARRSLGWAELPWLWMVAWCLASVAGVVGLHAWRIQLTARRRAEELVRLGQVARLNTLGELAGGMAHELNQPLTAVLASTQAALRVLADDPPDLDLTRQAMDHAVTQARRASEVLSRLRRMVERPDAARPAQPVHLADAAREVVDLLAPECAARQVSVNVVALSDDGLAPAVVAAVGGGLATQVVADPVALQQIIHNLIMNALQALERVPAGERHIVLQVGLRNVASDGNALAWQGVLVVVDSGPGLTPEALPRLFEPFYSTRPGGLGLGLSLCETLALGMGGGLTAGHNKPRGARFELSLPLVVARATGPASRPAAPKSVPSR